MEILSILLILFPTIVLITINFKKNFRDTNPLISFIGLVIVFVVFFLQYGLLSIIYMENKYHG